MSVSGHWGSKIPIYQRYPKFCNDFVNAKSLGEMKEAYWQLAFNANMFGRESSDFSQLKSALESGDEERIRAASEWLRPP